MTHKVVVKCTKCKRSYPITDQKLWTFINVELKEMECPDCGSTTFSVTEVPDR
jgi:Zn finger protein HypA/HybF involved in hydrogenase expression